MGDNTVLCVVYILTKWRGKTSLLGGCGSMKKRGGDMHYMNGCGVMGSYVMMGGYGRRNPTKTYKRHPLTIAGSMGMIK